MRIGLLLLLLLLLLSLSLSLEPDASCLGAIIRMCRLAEPRVLQSLLRSDTPGRVVDKNLLEEI